MDSLRGLFSLPLVGRGGWLGEGDTEEVVQQVEGHPGVGGPRAVHRPPARVGGVDVGVAGVIISRISGGRVGGQKYSM